MCFGSFRPARASPQMGVRNDALVLAWGGEPVAEGLAYLWIRAKGWPLDGPSKLPQKPTMSQAEQWGRWAARPWAPKAGFGTLILLDAEGATGG